VNPSVTDRNEALEEELHERICLELEQHGAGRDGLPPERAWLADRLGRMLKALGVILSRDKEATLIGAVIDRVLGLGLLQPLIDDPTISEIMVNRHDQIYIERRGRLERSPLAFRDQASLRQVIERIVSPIGRHVDESSPLVDARLADGSRVNAIIPPLALYGPVLTVRKFDVEPFDLPRLVECGTLNQPMADYLHTAIRERRSLIIAGGTGSGKTTTLNALGRCIPGSERVITIEDSAELSLGHPHLVALESRPANIEGLGEVTIRTLVRNALRMRPDRIIVGEVRGGEAFDMLQAMNTGHRGSLTTLHANSPGDALIRLESMVLMAGLDLPVSAIRRMIGGAIDVIAQQDRLEDGRRVMTAIARVWEPEPGGVRLETLFAYDPGAGIHVGLQAGTG
jgi:pilus assembly protein CpaF